MDGWMTKYVSDTQGTVQMQVPLYVSFSDRQTCVTGRLIFQEFKLRVVVGNLKCVDVLVLTEEYCIIAVYVGKGDSALLEPSYGRVRKAGEFGGASRIY